MSNLTLPIRQVNLSEDEALAIATSIRPASPFSPYGTTPVQFHNSPMETLRLTGFPRLDTQFELSGTDQGVKHE